MTEDEYKLLDELIEKDRSGDLEEDDSYTLQDLMERASAIASLSLPIPQCCEESRKYPVICFHEEIYGDFFNVGSAGWEISPLQKLQDIIMDINTKDFAERRRWIQNRPKPKFCPYCGKKLPKMVKKDPQPERICKVTDGGNYCDTCNERLRNCYCLPPEAAWEEEK
jgi:hypothetical protein